jgi:hypothetical protein
MTRNSLSLYSSPQDSQASFRVDIGFTRKDSLDHQHTTAIGVLQS